MMYDVSEFISSRLGLMLSSVDQEGTPHASVAPFVFHDEIFYIYISDMAKHAHNLKQSATCALLFTEDESECENIFARKRIMIQASAECLERQNGAFDTLMQIFEKRFDTELIKMLKSMLDFNLFALKPINGEAVFGFGQAFTFVGSEFASLKQKEATGHIKS